MRVRDLIKQLQEHDPNQEVYCFNGDERYSKVEGIHLTATNGWPRSSFSEKQNPRGASFLRIQ